MNRDLAAELRTEENARELEQLRELRALVLGAYDINGELMGAHRALYFDETGSGPLFTMNWELVEKLTVAALKAVRR